MKKKCKSKHHNIITSYFFYDTLPLDFSSIIILYSWFKYPSLKDKAIIYGALGYFILPIDLIPDYIPVIGLSDDFGALIYAYNIIKDNINDDIRGKDK